jgi:Ca2+-binding EF-hand superfamily protein
LLFPGTLGLEEFLTALQDASLDLAPEQLEAVRGDILDGEDTAVRWAEFVRKAPVILSRLSDDSAEAPGAADWCELTGKFDGGSRYWYNKRARTGQYEMPQEVEDENAAAKTPSLGAYLQTAFRTADKDGSGQLNCPELSELLQGMALGLTEQQTNMLWAEMDTDGDGHVSFEEFTASAPELLKQVYTKVGSTALGDWALLPVSESHGVIPYGAFLEHCPELVKQVFLSEPVSFEKDWCQIPYRTAGKDLRHWPRYFLQADREKIVDAVWYDKRRGILQLPLGDGPVESINAAAEAYTKKILTQQPSLRNLLSRRFKQLDEQEHGLLTLDQLKLLLSELELGLMPEQNAFIIQSLATIDDYGSVEWPEFISSLPTLLQQVHSRRHEFEPEEHEQSLLDVTVAARTGPARDLSIEDGVDGWGPIPFRDFGSLPWKKFCVFAPKFLKAVCGKPISSSDGVDEVVQEVQEGEGVEGEGGEQQAEELDEQQQLEQLEKEVAHLLQPSECDPSLAWKVVPSSAWEEPPLRYRYINSVTGQCQWQYPFLGHAPEAKAARETGRQLPTVRQYLKLQFQRRRWSRRWSRYDLEKSLAALRAKEKSAVELQDERHGRGSKKKLLHSRSTNDDFDMHSNQETQDDAEEQAHLHRIEFWRMISELHLDMSEPQLSGLRSKLELAGSEGTNWLYFLRHAPTLLQSVMDEIKADSMKIHAQKLAKEAEKKNNKKKNKKGRKEAASAEAEGDGWDEAHEWCALPRIPDGLTRKEREVEEDKQRDLRQQQRDRFKDEHPQEDLPPELALEFEEKKFLDDHYWYNKLTGVGQWTKPAAIVRREARDATENISAFLATKFKQKDSATKQAKIERKEFWSTVKDMDLKLSTRQLTMVQILLNDASHELITWTPLPPGALNHFWYHQSSGKAQFDKPAIVMERESTLSRHLIMQYMQPPYRHGDPDQTGNMKRKRFWTVTKMLALALTDEQCAQMQAIMDAPGRETSLLYRMGVPDSDESRIQWTELRSDGKNGYWFNKRTSETQWDKPAAVWAEEHRVPEVWEYLNVYLSVADKRGSGEAKEEEVWSLMNDSELEMNPNQLEWLQGAMDWSNEMERIELPSFIHHIPLLVQQIARAIEETDADWVLLTAPKGMLKNHFWYNKRTMEKQWKKPSAVLEQELMDARRKRLVIFAAEVARTTEVTYTTTEEVKYSAYIQEEPAMLEFVYTPAPLVFYNGTDSQLYGAMRRARLLHFRYVFALCYVYYAMPTPHTHHIARPVQSPVLKLTASGAGEARSTWDMRPSLANG